MKKIKMPKLRGKEKESEGNKTKKNRSFNKLPKVTEKVDFDGEKGFTHAFGYRDEDAYLFVGQKSVISVFDVLVQYGSYNEAPIGWLLNLIPKMELKHGNVMFTQRQKGMEKDKENSVIERDIETNITTISESGQGKSSKQRAQNVGRVWDMKLAGELSGKGDTIIDSDLRLIVKARTPKDVEKTIKELKNNYKHYDVKGIIFVRQSGEQLEEMSQLFSHVTADAWHASDMNSVAAGRIFLPSSGFSDAQGTYVGTDIRALLTNNPAIIDFTDIKNATIFMGNISVKGSIGGIEGGGMLLSGGSAVAHVLSEANYLAGKRIHHITMSDFGYRAPDSLVFDMSKEAINPLEVFGTPETVQIDATANFNKATTMMLLLSNTVDKQRYAELEAELKSVLIDWMIYRAGGQGMYTNDPENEPNRAEQILATGDHENYPTPFELLPALNDNVAKRANEGEYAREKADFLHMTLKTAFSEFPSIFHKVTTLPDVYKSTDRNIYYDLSKLTNNTKVTSAVFLNVLAYVTNRALEGEQIVIHGLDYIDIPVDYLVPYRERIARKSVGLVSVYEKAENKINPHSYSRFSGRLSQQDAVVLGAMTQEELAYINDSWRQPLPSQVSNVLLEGHNGILYFYRKKDRVGALVQTHLIL
ncbi:hypothetical protein [Listeria sp. ILCC797]|uniref:hypothetical protein n=1 Tax=Listeria sp. ILCC797 TaxID=1918333 RepID=UPI000B58B72B|nr:hypothetical protein [Listeria sp. ILCC797]